MYQCITASGAMVDDTHFASDCIKCGACFEKCPQHIKIPDELISVKRCLQVPGFLALVKFGVRIVSH